MKNLINYFRLLVIEGPKEFWADAVVYIRNKMDRHKIRQTIKECRKYTQIDRKRRYVVRGMDGRPMGVTSDQIKRLKRRGRLPKEVDILRIHRDSLAIVTYIPEYKREKGKAIKVKE
jgi:hypothetical protein